MRAAYNKAAHHCSLASHTSLISRERGSGDYAYELFWRQDLVVSNQIQDLNLLLSNDLLAACAHTVGPVLFVVTRDVFCNYLHSTGKTSCTRGHQTPLFLGLGGVVPETTHHCRLRFYLLNTKKCSLICNTSPALVPRVLP